MATLPPMDFASGDHYAVLGVAKTATEADLTRNYKELARKYHPDKNPDNKSQAEVAFKRIAEAYSVLRDAEKRREYDRTGGVRSYVSYEEADRLWRNHTGEAQAAPAASVETKRMAAAVVLIFTLALTVPETFMSVLPGLVVCILGMAILNRQGSPSVLVIALLLAGYAVPYSGKFSGIFQKGARGTGSAPSKGKVTSEVPVGIVPYSGEEMLMSDGRVVRIADPMNRASGETSVTDGWKERMLQGMVEVISKGEEQVLMVFSRRGCGPCSSLVPVLQRAIQRRSGSFVEEPLEEGDPQAFLLPMGRASLGMGGGPVPSAKGGLLFAPLRVFVFEANEFPEMMQKFQVQAFPTLVAWGSIGVAPLMAVGLLDDASLNEMLRQVAMGVPEEAEPPQKKKKGLFR